MRALRRQRACRNHRTAADNDADDDHRQRDRPGLGRRCKRRIGQPQRIEVDDDALPVRHRERDDHPATTSRITQLTILRIIDTRAELMGSNAIQD